MSPQLSIRTDTCITEVKPAKDLGLFPPRFGLKALPGRVFRVARTSVEDFQIVLHLEVLQESWWARHMRITVNEFLVQRTECPK